jgi:hypothetical protein
LKIVEASISALPFTIKNPLKDIPPKIHILHYKQNLAVYASSIYQSGHIFRFNLCITCRRDKKEKPTRGARGLPPADGHKDNEFHRKK